MINQKETVYKTLFEQLKLSDKLKSSMIEGNFLIINLTFFILFK